MIWISLCLEDCPHLSQNLSMNEYFIGWISQHDHTHLHNHVYTTLQPLCRLCLKRTWRKELKHKANASLHSTWPTSFGFLVSVMSYCRMSPWSQLLKYKNLSSKDRMMSVISPGISGSAQPSTFLFGMAMTFSAAHVPACLKSQSKNIINTKAN